MRVLPNWANAPICDRDAQCRGTATAAGGSPEVSLGAEVPRVAAPEPRSTSLAQDLLHNCYPAESAKQFWALASTVCITSTGPGGPVALRTYHGRVAIVVRVWVVGVGIAVHFGLLCFEVCYFVFFGGDSLLLFLVALIYVVGLEQTCCKIRTRLAFLFHRSKGLGGLRDKSLEFSGGLRQRA